MELKQDFRNNLRKLKMASML